MLISFGHMHEPFSYEKMECGGEPRRFYQDISLFGRKIWGEHQEERRHGYSSFQLEIDKKIVTTYPMQSDARTIKIKDLQCYEMLI